MFLFILKNNQLIQAGLTYEKYASPLLRYTLGELKSITSGPFLFPDLLTEDTANLYYAFLNAIRSELAQKYEIIDFYQLQKVRELGVRYSYDNKDQKYGIEEYEAILN